MSRVVARLLVAVALAGSLFVMAPGTAAPAAEPAHRAGPGYHQPKVGTCYDLTRRQLFARAVTERSVPCTSRHTSVVVSVTRLPRDTNWNRLPLYPAKRCAAKVLSYLDANDRAVQSSAYDWFWFTPSKRERARGARWISCHLALWGGKTMKPLPTDGRPTLDPLPLEDDVARCLTGEKLLFTVCAKPHNHRVTGAFRMRATTFPTYEQFQRAAQRSCPKRVTSRRWRWEALYKPEWAAGYRTVVCYSKTSK